MSDMQAPREDAASTNREEMLSALFAQLVMQQANLAVMLLGKVPHPDTGEVTKDIEAARLFIDQLDMLEVKTKGNLTKEEANLLKQSLMNLRLAFVQAVEEPSAPPSAPQPAAAEPANAPPAQSTPAAPKADEDEEHRKKFSKKY